MKFYAENAQERSARVLRMSLPGTDPQFQFLLIGAGMMGREHIRVTRLLGKASIRGLFDPHPQSVDAALALYDDAPDLRPVVYESLHESLQAALTAGAFDAILICTPNFTHFDIVQQAAATGLPLFVEKPMATSLADAAKLVVLNGSYPGFIQLGMQYRYKSQYTEAFHATKQLQALGAVKTISMNEYRPPFLDKVTQWNKFNEYSGGTLVEKCCHYFDLINLMAESRPASVYASGGQAVNFLDFTHAGRAADIHDHGFVIINYENGIHASFTLNMFSQELQEELIVSGEKGSLFATEHSSFKTEGSIARIKVQVAGHDDYAGREVTYPALVERSGHHGATFFEHEALIAQLQGKPTDCASVVQGLWAMIVASAAQESIAQQRVINVEEYLETQGLSRLWEQFTI